MNAPRLAPHSLPAAARAVPLPRRAHPPRPVPRAAAADPVYFVGGDDDSLASPFSAGLATPHISPFDAAALGVPDATLAVLASAYLAGKRKISVRDTAAAAGVPRAAALAWFRRVDALPRAAAESALTALVAASDATLVLDAAAKERRVRGRAEAAAREGPPPDWRAPKSVDKLSAASRATLDAVAAYFEGDWPPDDVLDGLWREARVPRAVAKEYFQSLRVAAAVAREERRGRRRDV